MDIVKPTAPNRFVSALPMAGATLLAAAFMALGVWVTIEWRPHSATHASSAAEVEMPDQDSHNSSRKSGGLISSQIDLASEYVSEKAFTLRGTMSSNADLDDVEYKWNVPEDVKVLSGERKGSAVVGSGGQVEFYLQVVALTPGPKAISLQTSTKRGRKRIGDVATFLTQEHEKSDSDSSELSKALSDLNILPAAPAPRSPEEFRRRAIH